MGTTIYVIGDAIADVIAGPLDRKPVAGGDVEVSVSLYRTLSAVTIFILRIVVCRQLGVPR